MDLSDVKKVNLRKPGVGDLRDDDAFRRFEEFEKTLDQPTITIEGSRSSSFVFVLGQSPFVGNFIVRLTVGVLAARDLIAADWNGLSDPFLIIQYDNIQHKGKVHKKTLDPKFNETCKFQIDPSKFVEIMVEVWDYDAIGKNDFLGVTYIPVNNILNGKVESAPEWIPLRGRKFGEKSQGDVQVKLKSSVPLAVMVPKRVYPHMSKSGLFDFDLSQDELLSVFSAEEKTLFEKLSKLVESGKDVIAALDNVLGASGSVPVPIPDSAKKRSSSFLGKLQKEMKKPVKVPSFYSSSKKSDKKSEFGWDVVVDSKAASGAEVELQLNILPEEMLVYVFRYLTDKDKGRAARVCVEWSRIMQDKSLKAQYVRVLELTKKAKATGHDDFDTFSALKEIHEFMQVLNLGDAWEVEVYATIQRSSSFSVGVTENFAIRLPLLNKLFELQELCMQLLVYKNSQYRSDLVSALSFFNINSKKLIELAAVLEPELVTPELTAAVATPGVVTNCITFLTAVSPSRTPVENGLRDIPLGYLNSFQVIVGMTLDAASKRLYVMENDLREALRLGVLVLALASSHSSFRHVFTKPQENLKVLASYADYLDCDSLLALSMTSFFCADKSLLALVAKVKEQHNTASK